MNKLQRKVFDDLESVIVRLGLLEFEETVDHGVLTMILVVAILMDDLIEDGVVPFADALLEALLHILEMEPPQERQVISLVSQAHELQHLRHR